MVANSKNEVRLLCGPANGFGSMLELNGNQVEVYCEVTTGADFRRNRRYGVRVAPDYNVSGVEWVWGRNVASVVKKLASDTRKLVA